MFIKINLTLCCCLALIFLGCQSDKLDKSQVENQLKEYLKLYSKESNFITIGGVVRKSEIDDNRQFREEFSSIKPFLDAGLVKKEKEEYRPETRKVSITYSLSKIGKAHLIEETRSLGDYPIFKVKCFDIEFGEITGIREINPSQYAVEFYIKKET